MNAFDAAPGFPAAPAELLSALEAGGILVLPSAMIDGNCEIGSGERHVVVDPSTGGAIGEFHAAGAAQVSRAVASAVLASAGWRARGRAERAALLEAIAGHVERHAAVLARLQAFNNGKPAAEARADVADVVATFRYYAGLCASMRNFEREDLDLGTGGYRAAMHYEPCGTAALIVPWNFPMVTTAWKTAAALAAGCTVVLKPSELTPVAELALASLMQDAGLPRGVLNVVFGAADTGRRLVRDPAIAKVSFTGSTEAGSVVMQECARRIARVSLELGGKSALIVCADADVDRAVELAMGGAFYNAGQMCSATSRILVHRSVHERFVAALCAAAASIRVGGRLHAEAGMGPLISARQRDKVQSFIDAASAAGIPLLASAPLPESTAGGFYVAPRVYGDVPADHPLWREEIFGPIACVRAFDSNDEAVRIANDSDYGLVATVVTEDEAAARDMASRLVSGLVWINAPQVIFPGASWGGFRRSGIGRELGVAGLRAYQEMKQVLQPVR